VLKLRNRQRLKHTLHTSLLRGMKQDYIPRGLTPKPLFFADFWYGAV